MSLEQVKALIKISKDEIIAAERNYSEVMSQYGKWLSENKINISTGENVSVFGHVAESIDKNNATLYSACAMSIVSMDAVVRPMLENSNDAEAVGEVADFMTAVVKILESTVIKIDAFINGSYAATGSFDLAPSASISAIQKYWVAKYRILPGAKERDERITASSKARLKRLDEISKTISDFGKTTDAEENIKELRQGVHSFERRVDNFVNSEILKGKCDKSLEAEVSKIAEATKEKYKNAINGYIDKRYNSKKVKEVIAVDVELFDIFEVPCDVIENVVYFSINDGEICSKEEILEKNCDLELAEREIGKALTGLVNKRIIFRITDGKTVKYAKNVKQIVVERDKCDESADGIKPPVRPDLNEVFSEYLKSTQEEQSSNAEDSGAKPVENVELLRLVSLQPLHVPLAIDTRHNFSEQFGCLTGTAVIDSQSRITANGDERFPVRGWRDIVSIFYYSNRGLAGIKSDGTVLFCEEKEVKEITAPDVRCFVYALGHPIVLMNDGSLRVLANYKGLVKDSSSLIGFNDKYKEIFSWWGIKAISGNKDHLVGFSASGKVRFVGSDEHGEEAVLKWDNIVAIDVGESHIIGLKRDGSVVGAGDNEFDQRNVSAWRDIISVSAGALHTVGLKIDGTVVATGNNYYHECDVSAWRDIVYIYASGCNTIGIDSRGTAYVVGEDKEEIDKVLANKTVKIPFGRKEHARTFNTLFERRANGVCRHCGGKFKGLFKKICKECGKEKDY